MIEEHSVILKMGVISCALYPTDMYKSIFVRQQKSFIKNSIVTVRLNTYIQSVPSDFVIFVDQSINK